ncbi:MAG TPA: hypothetical protein VFP12_04215 [Allosphingosinicella sp.]|nr:hypothetical protein [Allosphingosinicella sp.]
MRRVRRSGTWRFRPSLTVPARLGIALAAAACFADGQPASAASFNIPPACNGLASGSEDELDPVVLVTYNAGRTFLYNFPLNRHPQSGNWYVTLQNPADDFYFFATTYTPFLTSTLSIQIRRAPSQTVFLPAAGISGSTNWQLFPVYTVTVVDSGNHPIRRAIVDFIPAYAGSSPYTMQADANGNIAINCLQTESTGYAVTVYSDTGDYLYDGGFPVDKSGHSNTVINGTFGVEPKFSRPRRKR